LAAGLRESSRPCRQNLINGQALEWSFDFQSVASVPYIETRLQYVEHRSILLEAFGVKAALCGSLLKRPRSSIVWQIELRAETVTQRK